MVSVCAAIGSGLESLCKVICIFGCFSSLILELELSVVEQNYFPGVVWLCDEMTSKIKKS